MAHENRTSVPAGLPFSPEIWEATPCEVRAFILALLQRLEAVEEQLNRNSKNSSSPPSSDPPGTLPNRRKKKGERQRGGQSGHKGHNRKLVPPEQVTAVHEIVPECCGGCGQSLIGEPTSLQWRRQIVELPKMSAEVTEYRFRQAQCPSCSKSTTASVPADLSPGAFGPRLMSFAAMLTGRYRLSRRDAEDLLSQSTGIEISLGALIRCEDIVSRSIEGACTQVADAIRAAKAVNMDDTTWLQQNSRAVLWNANTPECALYRITGKKDAKTAKEILGEFSGTLGSDRASTYNFYTGKRQLCWAHIDRHLLRIAERGGLSKKVGEWGMAEVDRLFKVWHELRSGQINRAVFRGKIKSIRARMGRLLLQGTKSGQPKTERTCGKILNDFSYLWTFAEIEGVEPTNNSAEQALRAGVRWRRTSFGSQSASGSTFVERFLTVAETCRRQQKKLLEFLTNSVGAYLQKRPSLPILV